MEVNKKSFGDESNLKISEDVIARIAITAAGDVQGVAGMAASTAAQGVKRAFGIKGEAKGASISIENGEVIIDLFINVNYGTKIKEVAEEVQKSVRTAVETMTSMMVSRVNVCVAGLVFETENKANKD